MEEQNLPTEEMPNPEVTQPQAPQPPQGPEVAKKSGMRWLIAGFVLVLVMLGLYFFVVPMLQDAGGDDTDAPPRASLDQGGKFQGAIFDGPMGMLVYEKSDEVAFGNYKRTLSTAQVAKPTKIGKNVNYYYSDDSISFNEITKCIDPRASQILIMYYSPGEAEIRGREYGKGFTTFPKGPFVDNESVKFFRADGTMEIPAGRAFVVISKAESEAFCFKGANELSTTPTSNTVTLGEKGWITIAANNISVEAALEKVKPYVRSVWVQEGITPKQLVKDKGEKYSTPLTGSKILWVKLDGTVKKVTPKIDLTKIKTPELIMSGKDKKITLSWTPISAEDAKHFAGYMLYYVPLNKVIAENSTFDQVKEELGKIKPEPSSYFLKGNIDVSSWFKQLYEIETTETAKLKAAGVTEVEFQLGLQKAFKPLNDTVLLPMTVSSFDIDDYTKLKPATQYIFILSPTPNEFNQEMAQVSFKIFTPVTNTEKATALFGEGYEYETKYVMPLILKKGVGLAEKPKEFKLEEKDADLELTWTTLPGLVGYALFDGSEWLQGKSKLGILAMGELNSEIEAEIDLFINGTSQAKTLGEVYKMVLEKNGRLLTAGKFTIKNFKVITEAEKKYRFALVSISQDGTLSDLAVVDWTREADAIKLDPPKNVKVTATENGVTVTWDPASTGETPEGYGLVYTPYDKDKAFDPLDKGSYVELTKDILKATGADSYIYEFTTDEFAALNPGTYKVSVYSVIGGKALSAAASSAEFTIAGPEPLFPPTDVKVEATTEGITVTWKPATTGPTPQEYGIVYMSANIAADALDPKSKSYGEGLVELNSKELYSVIGPGPYEYELTKDEVSKIPAGKYKAAVGVIGPEVEGIVLSEPSAPFIIAPAVEVPLSPPTGVTVEAVAAKITVTWSPATTGKTPEGYGLVYTPYDKDKAFDPQDDGMVELKVKIKCNTGPCSYTLTPEESKAIKEGTYKFTVVAMGDEEGEYEFASSAEFIISSTEPAAPVTPDFMVTALSNDKALKLTWTNDPGAEETDAEEYKVLFILSINGTQEEIYSEATLKAEKKSNEYTVKYDSNAFTRCMRGDTDIEITICKVGIQALAPNIKEGKVVSKPIPQEAYSWFN